MKPVFTPSIPMRPLPVLLLLACLASAVSARATVSFDLAVDRLETAGGAPVAPGTLAILVADTNGDGLAQAAAGSLALRAALDGPGGDDLIVYRSDLSGMGLNGALGVSTGGLALDGSGIGQWSEGDPIYLVWFPNLTIASGSLAAGEAYGARSIGLTPADGGNDLLAYVAPSSSGSFGGVLIPSGATDLRSDQSSYSYVEQPLVGSPTSGAITETAATLGGSVLSEQGGAVSQRGVVYAVASSNPDPLIGGPGVSLVSAGSGSGAFTTPVSGLTGGTTYAFRAFATNQGGTGYSAAAAFTTDTNLVLSGGLASVARSLLPGDRHRFRFTIDGPRYLNLTTGGVPVIARLYNSSGQLIAEQATEGTVTFANLQVQSGQYTLDLSRAPAPGGAMPYTLSVDASTSVFAKPDATVGTSLTSQTGSNVYLPTLQQLTLVSPDGRAVTGYITTTNRGNTADRFGIRGTPGNVDFTVVYYNESGANVTAGVTAGSYLTALAAPSTSVGWIRAVITPSRRAVLQRRSQVLSVDGTSQFNPMVKDGVSIRVNTR